MTTVAPRPPPFWEIVDLDPPVAGDGRLVLRFHEGHLRAWNSRKGTIAMISGVQVGKTVFIPHWLKREADERGPGDYLAASATYPLMDKTLLPQMKLVFEVIYRTFTYKAGSRIFESHEKLHGAPATRIIMGSAENPGSLESMTALGIALDEAGQHQFTRSAYEAVVRRRHINRARMLIATTPYEWGWLKEEIYDRAIADPVGSDIELIQIESIVNPAFSREEFEKARKTLPPEKFDMFYRGMFTRPAGAIYDCFNPHICRIPRFQIPESWPRYVGHDFGPQNMAALWVAQDPGTGYLYAYREYLRGGLKVFDHVNTHYKPLSRGETIIKRVGGANVEDGWREAATAAGWPISKPREFEVEVGINAVYGWMQQNKLFVFDDLKRLSDEITTYSRVLDENNQPTEAIKDKADYHLLDALRYLLIDFAPESVGSREVAVVYHPQGGDDPWTRRRFHRRGVRAGAR